MRLLPPLELPCRRTVQLGHELYYLAGHYFAPSFRNEFGESPQHARRKLLKIKASAETLNQLLTGLSFGELRYLHGTRWTLKGERKGDREFDWYDLPNQLADLAKSAWTVATEMPQLRRGTNAQLLKGRWLRQSAHAIEQATGRDIETKTSDSAGRNYRLLGTDGAVFESYCFRVAKANVTTRTIVQAVREMHKDRDTGPAL